jgi:7-carboxy-7-deazaguanine synthase
MAKIYSVKEIFYTLQGEGMQAGRAAVFCRFAGCNLWSGREVDRERAVCRFCDTDFVGVDGSHGGKYTRAEALAERIVQCWPDRLLRPYVVCTGGEPLLQLDTALLQALHDRRCEVAIETNGTLPVPPGVDWVCVSPKSGAPLRVTQGHELKVVIPQAGQNWAEFEQMNFDYLWVQPMDGPLLAQHTQLAIAHCQLRPRWRLSLQRHKWLGIR